MHGPVLELGVTIAVGAAPGSGGRYRATNPDAGGADALFYTATNATELVTALNTFARAICCGCIN